MSTQAILLIILEVLEILAMALRLVPEAHRRLKVLKAELERFVTEGRDPTPEEFEALMAESRKLHDAIQAGRS